MKRIAPPGIIVSVATLSLHSQSARHTATSTATVSITVDAIANTRVARTDSPDGRVKRSDENALEDCARVTPQCLHDRPFGTISDDQGDTPLARKHLVSMNRTLTRSVTIERRKK
jgi:hypothetical protein